MKTSKRNLDKAAKKAEKLKTGKPNLSKYEAKKLNKLGVKRKIECL